MSASRPEVEARLRAEGLAPEAWSSGPGTAYAAHAHHYDKTLVVAEGSIEFGLPASGKAALLEVGDRLDLPAGTNHDALVGPNGVVCLEAHLPAGSLGVQPRHRGLDW